MGGIYGGVFTATEGAGIGAFGGLLLRAGAPRARPGARCSRCWSNSRTTAMLFMILIGALIFANFVNYTTMPADLKALVTHST